MEHEYKESQFSYACRKYLTPDENRLLTYEQKVELLNYEKAVQRSDARYYEIRGIASRYLKACQLENQQRSNMLTLIDDLAELSEFQKEILRLRVQLYTQSEVGEMLGVTRRAITWQLELIQKLVNIEELLCDTGIAWQKKDTKAYRG